MNTAKLIDMGLSILGAVLAGFLILYTYDMYKTNKAAKAVAAAQPV
jgi:cbb3-type cytochrome oxidase subunit 3